MTYKAYLTLSQPGHRHRSFYAEKTLPGKADKDPRKVRQALERLKLHSKLIKHCHNQARSFS
jgi:hypothetical protein